MMTLQPFSMFSQTFVLNMTLLLVVIKDAGMTDVFFSETFLFSFGFCASGISLVHNEQ